MTAWAFYHNHIYYHISHFPPTLQPSFHESFPTEGKRLKGIKLTQNLQVFWLPNVVYGCRNPIPHTRVPTRVRWKHFKLVDTYTRLVQSREKLHRDFPEGVWEMEKKGSKIPSSNFLTSFCRNSWGFLYATSRLNGGIMEDILRPSQATTAYQSSHKKESYHLKKSSSKLGPSSQIFPWPNCTHFFQADRNLPKTNPWAKWKVPGKNDKRFVIWQRHQALNWKQLAPSFLNT